MSARRCPECGARLGEAESCEALFHAALAAEWSDPPRTWEAHHLLVATYMLQHPSRLTPDGRAAFERAVVTTVDEGLTVRQLRERNRGRLDQQKRDWNIRAQKPNRPELRAWGATIADVVDGSPERLPERVWRWARKVRDELRIES